MSTRRIPMRKRARSKIIALHKFHPRMSAIAFACVAGLISSDVKASEKWIYHKDTSIQNLMAEPYDVQPLYYGAQIFKTSFRSEGEHVESEIGDNIEIHEYTMDGGVVETHVWNKEDKTVTFINSDGKKIVLEGVKSYGYNSREALAFVGYEDRSAREWTNVEIGQSILSSYPTEDGRDMVRTFGFHDNEKENQYLLYDQHSEISSNGLLNMVTDGTYDLKKNQNGSFSEINDNGSLSAFTNEDKHALEYSICLN